jgi:hypothetical protein
MRFVYAGDPEAAALSANISARAIETDAPGLMTANLWLWDIEPDRPESDARVVLGALFRHTGLPCPELLEPHAASGPWVDLTPQAAQALTMRLLTSGASLESAAFEDEPQAATEFVDRLFGWVGRPLAAFANMEHRADGVTTGFRVFHVPHWVDEGLVLVGSERVGLLWFMGTD